ncbi:CocE/NonD family hydrolase [Paenibacillus mendelii]|nr:CocE/NonD family hydrolase [Paenibacillus mendelii]
MRDGTILRADLYRKQDAPPSPVLLARTPYSKNISAGEFAHRAAAHGYVVVIQDTRGRYDSDGSTNMLTDERDDGYDTIEWAAAQQWSSGVVGMFGSSYVGMTQWLAAMEKPPHLKAIAPFFTTPNFYPVARQGGGFQSAITLWSLGLSVDVMDRHIQAGSAPAEDKDVFTTFVENYRDALSYRPAIAHPLIKRYTPWLLEMLRHPDYDDYWKQISASETLPDLDLPILHLVGWFDLFLGMTVDSYNDLGKTRGKQMTGDNRLIIGPWSHSSFTGVFPDIQFGERSSMLAIDSDGIMLRFFDYWLRNIDNGWAVEPNVQYFLMGDNVWKTTEKWPPAETLMTAMYLHSGGKANTLHGDGTLNWVCPGEELEDRYLCDPRLPVPTRGGQTLLPPDGESENSGPLDQQQIESRLDVLCYTSEPMAEPLEVAGPITATLYASSSAKDTDWIMKLIDVYPDGRALILTEGIVRSRYRHSFEKQELLEPEQVYEFPIDLWATANVFLPGHRIRVEISSSSFPRFEPNTHTGGVIAEEGAADMMPALNRIYHSERYPSHILLPVQPATPSI